MALVVSFSLLSKALLGLAVLLTIHALAEAELARLTFALSIATAASGVLGGSANRVYVAGHRRLRLDELAPAFLTVQVLASAAAAVLGLPLAGWMGGLYGLAAALMLAQVLADYAQTCLQQELKFFRYSLLELGRSGGQLAALLAVLAATGGALEAWQVLAVQALALLAAFAVAAWGRLSPRRMADLAAARDLLRSLLRGRYACLFGYFAVLGVFAQIDVWVLRAVGDDLTLATYGSAFRYYSLLGLALGAAHVVLLPHAGRLEGGADLDVLLGKHRLVVALFVPLVLLGAALAGWAIPWIDRGRYPEAVAVFRILALSAVLSFALSPHVNVLFRFETYRFLFLLVCLVLPIHAGLCLCLARLLGAQGAALATLVSYGLLNGLCWAKATRLRFERRPEDV
jgi:O-antigen/teichoic acid export membrane protein